MEEVCMGSNWGKHVICDLYGCDLSTMTNAQHIKDFVKELVKQIDMIAFGETVVVHFGDNEKVEGFTMAQMIQTSMISAHFANHTKAIYLDVFSCKDFSSKTVVDLAGKWFKASSHIVHVIERK